jgi:hypothetical protein
MTVNWKIQVLVSSLVIRHIISELAEVIAEVLSLFLAALKDHCVSSISEFYRLSVNIY